MYKKEAFIPFPTIGEGKHKGRLVTTNNIPYWYRYKKTSLKNEFKNMLKGWIIEEKSEPKEEAFLIIQLHRNGKLKIDPDSGSTGPYKWLIDAFEENGWIMDDNNVSIIIRPTLYLEKSNSGRNKDVDIHIKAVFFNSNEKEDAIKWLKENL